MYHLYFDNFYTSTKLRKYLLVVGTYACGTMLGNRVGYPQQLKDIKQFNPLMMRLLKIIQNWIITSVVYCIHTMVN